MTLLSRILSAPITDRQIATMGSLIELACKIAPWAGVAYLVWMILKIAVAFLPGGPAWAVVHTIQ